MRLHLLQYIGLVCLSLIASLSLAGLLNAERTNVFLGDVDSVEFVQYMQEGEKYIVSNFDSAVFYFNKARDLAETNEEPINRIRAILSLAQSHVNASRYEQSIDLFFQAMRLAEEQDNAKLLSTAANGLGINYYYIGDYAKSEKYVRQSVEILRDAGLYEEYAIALSNLSGLYTLQGKTREALDMLVEAKALFSRENESAELLQVYNILGTTHRLNTGNYDSAAYYFNQYFKLSEARLNKEGMMVGAFNLGELLLEQKDLDRSEKYLLQSLEISSELQRDSYRLGIYNTLSDLYRQKSDYKTALDYKNKAYQLNDSIFQQESQEALSELELKYETEKKERKIKEQDFLLQRQKLENEQNRRRQNVIVFAAILVLIIGVFLAIWFYTRKSAKERLERERAAIYENIAHEIKTPLTLIKAPVQEIMSKGSESIRNELELIERNTRRLSTLVDEILELNQNAQPQTYIREVTGNPLLLIEELVSELKSGYSASPERIKLRINREGELKKYHYPAEAIAGILNNLLSNALKYSPEESPVEVKADIEEGTLHFSVQDFGPGIPKKHHQKIFKRFFRVDNQHSKSTGGKGIGLYLVKDLIEKLSGEIAMQSAIGEGTAFHVRIPLRESDEWAETTDTKGEKPGLLIVEDNIDLATFLASILGEEYQIQIEHDGMSGIDAAKKMLPDIILSDVMMPKADGIELLRSVKEDELSRHIPVVLFSAKSELEDRLRGLRFGADAYISKPFDTEELKLTVRNIQNTLSHAHKQFQEKVKSHEPFEERIKSEHSYLNKLTGYILKHIDNSEYSVANLADDMHISRSQLHRKVQSLSGLSTTRFMKMIRIEYAKDLMLNGDFNVSEVADKCGFSSASYFTHSFKEYEGLSPSEWKSKHSAKPYK